MPEILPHGTPIAPRDNEGMPLQVVQDILMQHDAMPANIYTILPLSKGVPLHHPSIAGPQLKEAVGIGKPELVHMDMWVGGRHALCMITWPRGGLHGSSDHCRIPGRTPIHDGLRGRSSPEDAHGFGVDARVDDHPIPREARDLRRARDGGKRLC